jgi:hypothetical protein
MKILSEMSSSGLPRSEICVLLRRQSAHQHQHYRGIVVLVYKFGNDEEDEEDDDGDQLTRPQPS